MVVSKAAPSQWGLACGFLLRLETVTWLYSSVIVLTGEEGVSWRSLLHREQLPAECIGKGFRSCCQLVVLYTLL